MDLPPLLLSVLGVLHDSLFFCHSMKIAGTHARSRALPLTSGAPFTHDQNRRDNYLLGGRGKQYGHRLSPATSHSCPSLLLPNLP